MIPDIMVWSVAIIFSALLFFALLEMFAEA